MSTKYPQKTEALDFLELELQAVVRLLTFMLVIELRFSEKAVFALTN